MHTKLALAGVLSLSLSLVTACAVEADDEVDPGSAASDDWSLLGLDPADPLFDSEFVSAAPFADSGHDLAPREVESPDSDDWSVGPDGASTLAAPSSDQWALKHRYAEPRMAAPSIYLAPDGDDTAMCASRETACRTFARANQLLTADGAVIRLAPGTYHDRIALDHAATVLGNGARLDVIDSQSLEPVVRAGYGELRVRDLQIYVANRQSIACGWGGVTLVRVATNAPIRCDRLGINRVRLDQVKTTGALIVKNGDLTIDRSLFWVSPGVEVIESSYAITNSVFMRHSSPVTFRGQLAPDQAHQFDSNTVLDGGSATQSSGTLDMLCEDGAPSDFRNDLVWTRFQPQWNVIASRGCRYHESAVWNYASPNPDPGLDSFFHLRAGSRLIDAGGHDITGRRDIDGDRLTGRYADIGADELVE